jgi:aminoglycoside phosphotransferase (APT) family kinase protein
VDGGPADLTTAVERVLEAATGDPIRLAGPPCRLTGGRSAELYTFRLSAPHDSLPGESVLRLPGPRSHVLREGIIQRAVARAGYPAPPIVLLDGGDANPFRGPYIVMGRVPGAPLFGGGGPIATFKAFRSVPAVLAALMADLHGIDPSPVARALAAGDVAAAELGTDSLLADIDPPVAEWLVAHAPEPTSDPVVCHGDLHALNVLVDDGRHAVVDWELATIADPAFDVGRTALMLRAVPVEMPDRLRPIVQRFGRRSADRFVGAYAAQRPLDERSLVWHEALHAARVGCRLARREPMSAHDPVLDAWAPTAPLLQARVRELTGVDLVM